VIARDATVGAAALPTLQETFFGLTVESLKWYATVLPGGKGPTRKADLVDALLRHLGDPGHLRRLWEQLTPGQRQVIGDVVHRDEGRYDQEVIQARYPAVPPPAAPPAYYYGYGAKPARATAFDLFFGRLYGVGTYIPSDLVPRLRALAPAPPPPHLATRADPPVELAAGKRRLEAAPQVTVTENERAALHDLTAALHLIQQGKASVGATTRLPTLGTVRQLRQRLLFGDDLDDDYERAEEAIRPFALLMLVQAAKWAAPAADNGGKLGLTKGGLAVLAAGVGAQQIRQVWDAWLKHGPLDELSRIRAIKGQGAKGIRLTKPAERRARIAAALAAVPPGRWVALDDFLRHLRAERLAPEIERGDYSRLYLGSSAEYGALEYRGSEYWDFVVGSYLRAVLWEYAGTLGLIELAYTDPEESPRDLSRAYGLDGEPYLSRYDGLLGFSLTGLGAYALGLAADYTPPAPAVADQRPVLTILPNLDVVITDARRITPNDRAFLERLGTSPSQDVYHLDREALLEVIESGLTLPQIRDFLAQRSGRPEAEFPQPVRVFFADLEQRLAALREADRVLVLDGPDPYLLTELAHDATLRASVQLATLAGRTILLVPLAQEAAVRRQLRRLGYLPRKP
jgi:hypothetical protein